MQCHTRNWFLCFVHWSLHYDILYTSWSICSMNLAIIHVYQKNKSGEGEIKQCAHFSSFPSEIFFFEKLFHLRSNMVWTEILTFIHLGDPALIFMDQIREDWNLLVWDYYARLIFTNLFVFPGITRTRARNVRGTLTLCRSTRCNVRVKMAGIIYYLVVQ
jgi:hypothetical protein